MHHLLHVQDAGKKQVAAILGILTARAATRPRPLLKLKPQHIAVQVYGNNVRLDLQMRLLIDGTLLPSARNNCYFVYI